ncbi:aminotransferase class IV [Pendulispora brunnea]|uniref:Aminotransferase class IV n=1 Tax=Pendulispora brunnea TaxID=2905690 RepID=A0ABZ2KJG9_9BACT
MDRYELNGAPVGVEDLSILGRVPYGHYTAMQVRDAGVRGLGLHLRRLQESTRELLGCEIDPDEVRRHMRHALGTSTEATMRVNVFPRNMDWLARRSAPTEVDCLVTVGAPREPSGTTPRVRTTRFERFLPSVKHIGIGLGVMQHGRRAIAEGWDDVLFLDSEGRIMEGSVWNIGFFDGARIVWPSAPALSGVAMQLVQLGLAKRKIPSETREVHLQDLGSFQCAFLTNTVQIVQPIARIDDTVFTVAPDLMATLTKCHQEHPTERL